MSLSETNIHLFRMVNDLGKQYTYLNPFFATIAEYTLYILLVSIIIFGITRNKNNIMMVICGAISFALAEIIGKLAGMIHSNDPPFAELTNVNQLIEKSVAKSFPSDHTMVFFSVCVTFWLFKRGWSFLWILQISRTRKPTPLGVG